MSQFVKFIYSLSYVFLTLLTLTNSPELLGETKRSSEVEQSAATGRIRYRDFQKITSTRSSVIPHADGKYSLVTAVRSGDPYAKLYKIDHESKGMSLVLDMKQNISALFTNESHDEFFLLMDANGDENYKIYQLSQDYKNAKLIFGHDGAKARPLAFSGDNKRLYFLSNHKDKKVYSLYRHEFEGQKTEILSQAGDNIDGALVSPSEKIIYVYKSFGNNERRLFMLDVSTKRLKPILSQKQTNYHPAFFSRDEQYVYINTDDSKDRRYCAKIRVGESPLIEPLRQQEDRDIDCYYDHRVDTSYALESLDGRTQVEIYKGVFKDVVKLPVPYKSVASHIQFLPESDKVIMKLSYTRSPGDYFLLDLSKGVKQAPVKLTQLDQSDFDPEDYADSYDIRYPSFDKLEIHGILFAKPSWLEDKQRRPVIIWPHGGPDSHAQHIYSPIFHYWVMNGYIVFAPNFRGSTGYGKNFETLNDRDWGEVISRTS